MGFESNIATVPAKTGLLFGRLIFYSIKFGGTKMQELRPAPPFIKSCTSKKHFTSHPITLYCTHNNIFLHTE